MAFLLYRQWPTYQHIFATCGLLQQPGIRLKNPHLVFRKYKFKEWMDVIIYNL